ncbi:hypothetical protein [Bradyrhizobium sp. ORS 285]|uniref:COG3904 family protein n=1 Tax=Bradyrhizobium sp. ORS 285 TaxID=115808 RepID=UPI0007C879E1|nr:hypothetical protein [Bradyrhizobium sp. ORS 285]
MSFITPARAKPFAAADRRPSLRLLTLVLLAVAALRPQPSAADETFTYDASKPMQFFNAGDTGNCNGCSWIAAEGTIQRDTPEVFRRFIAKGKNAYDIVFNSPGGDLTAAMKLGEMVREQNLHSSVGKTTGKLDAESGFINTIDGGKDPGRCASACVFAFLGGVRRAAKDGELGVQQFHDPEAIKEPKAKTASALDRAADQAMMGTLITYVLRMDASPKLLALAAAETPWREVRWLKRQEITDLGIEISNKYSSPMTIEPFGAGGAYVEINNRSTFVSFRLRLYCRGDASTVHLAMIPNWNVDLRTFEPTMRDIMEDRSVFLVSESGRRSFPLKLVALEAGPLGPQASAQIVGATMADLQAAKRVEIDYDGIGKVDSETAMGLEFDLAGDRRKIGIVARSCVK